MFIEQAAYVGDVLSYYTDAQLKESFINLAGNKKNLYQLAQNLGYKPKISTPAVTNITVYQLVPSIGTGANNRPDETYFLKIKDGLQVASKSNSSIMFRTVDSVDFANPTDREINVYSRNLTTGEPDMYLVTKKVQAISATEKNDAITTAGNQIFN